MTRRSSPLPFGFLVAAFSASCASDPPSLSDEVGGSGGSPNGIGGTAIAGTGAGQAGSVTSAQGGSAGRQGPSEASGSGAVSTGMGGEGGEDSSTGAGAAGKQGTSPPDPGPGGTSPYVRECHGDSLDCGDPELRCLGIREGETVFGFSCSNPCESHDDCSDASSGAEASAACIPFVETSHCLLLCLNGTQESACPDRMSCYSYPGSGVGYCLWP